MKRTMVLVACTVGAAALSAEAASAARPRVQILNVGAVSNSAIPVKLRWTVPSGAACDVTVTVTSKSGKAATETGRGNPLCGSRPTSRDWSGS